MKNLYKNHAIYFLKNKILISIEIILCLCLFSIAPFFINQSLLYSYNWIIYFIIYSIVILSSFALCYFFFISSKRNQYDQILNSLYSNSRKIFISKYLFLITVFSLFSLLNAIINTLFMFIIFKNNLNNFLYFLAIFISNLIVFNAFFWVFSLFSTFSKKLIYKNIINVTLVVCSISLPILLKTFSNRERYNKTFSELSKIVEVSKDKPNQDYYVAKNSYENKINHYPYFDLVNTFYFTSIAAFKKSFLSNYDPTKVLNSKFSNYHIKSIVENKKWNNNNDYFIYDLYTKPIVSYKNNELLQLINNKIYANNFDFDTINNVRNIIEKLEWNKLMLSSKIIKSIEILSGKNDNDIQYLRRDWKYILKNNVQLQNLIIKKFGLDFWNLLNEFYHIHSFNAYLNIDIKNSNFYFEKNIIDNDEYDLDNKINDIDKLYLKKHFVNIIGDKVFFNNNKSTRFYVNLNDFQKVFDRVNNQNDWENFIEENASLLNKINNIINDVYSFSNQFNTIEKIKLMSNSSITKYYKDILLPILELDSSFNLIYTFLFILIIATMVPIITFKSIKGEI